MKKIEIVTNRTAFKVIIAFIGIIFFLSFQFEAWMAMYYAPAFLGITGVLIMFINDSCCYRFKQILPLPLLFLIHSLIPAFIKAKENGEEFRSIGGTMSNPVEYEGYVPVYKYSIGFDIHNINYEFLIFTVFIFFIFLGLYYKKIVLIKEEEY